MKYKALVVDVDGTLLCGERQWVTTPCLQALQALQQRGIPVIISTGRGAFACEPEVLSGFRADYKVCANGAWVLDKDNRPIYSKRFTMEQVNALSVFGIENGYRMAFCFDDAYYAYVDYEGYIAFYKENAGNPICFKDGTDFTRHLESLPFCAYIAIPEEELPTLKALKYNFKIMEFTPGAYDISRESVSKASALTYLLNKIHIDWSGVVAIGDGVNDLEMIAAAGMGVAMGNARPEVKNIADFITGSVLGDGVVDTISRFF